MLLVYLFSICSSIICLFFVIRLFLHWTGLVYVLRKLTDWIDDHAHVHRHFKVPELNENSQENQFYHKVSTYVNSLASIEDSDSINLVSGRKSSAIILSLDDDQTVQDTFLGARVSWMNKVQRDDKNQVSSRSFVLKIKKKDKKRILKTYLQHIHTVCTDIAQRRKEYLKIYMNEGGKWRAFPFNHPSSFNTIVIDPDLMNKVRSDLENFQQSEEYCHRLGRAWKRSYLLYGPPGTGKSSFVAAMADFLSFDVYNLNLSLVSGEIGLNSLLLQTRYKSLIVIEDLDHHLLEKSGSKLLNFLDGLLGSSSCDGKVIIFTMKSTEGIDSDLLRPGKIDIPIHFPMCDFTSFKILAKNYLGVKEHKLFAQVEQIFQSGATLSLGEIGELMLVNRSSPTRALKSMIKALRSNGNGGCGKSMPGLTDSMATSPALTVTMEEASGMAWKETVPREFRKLYEMLRLKSCRKPGLFVDDDFEMIR